MSCVRTKVLYIQFHHLDETDLTFFEDAHKLLHIAYRSPAFPYSDYIVGKPLDTVNLDTLSVPKTGGKAYRAIVFSKLTEFTPVSMDVQKASATRGEIPARVCLLSKDMAEYRVYALPRDLELEFANLTLGS